MPTYRYQAQTRDGRLVTNTIEAVNLNLAIDTLTASKLKILEIKPVRFDPFAVFAALGKVDRESIVMMTRRMVALVRSGLAVDRSLQVLHEQEEDQRLKPILASVLHDIRVGSTLSWAMAKHPVVFDSLYISMVKVGETTGDLGGMMDKLGEFLERDLRVRKKAKAALTYPAFILVFCILVIAGIFMFVLPGLLDVFSQMASGELPVPTRVMFMIVSLARNPYVFLGLFLAVLYYLVYFQDYLKTPTGKYKFDRLKLTVPLFGDINKKMLVAHFCRVMGTLLSTGIPLTRGLEILMEFSENEFFRTSIVTPLYDGVREGQGVSQVMLDLDFFPDMVANMVAVGESTGEVPRMLLRISQFYDEEVIYTLDGLLALIEPIMVAGMGLLVCFVLLSVFLPLYQVIMSISS